MIRIPATTQQNLIVSKSDSVVYPPIDMETIDNVLKNAPSAVLKQEQALNLLDAIGITRERTLVATNIDQAREAVTDIGFPINMETILLRDGESKPVVEHITDRNTMRLEFGRLMETPDASGVLFRPTLSGSTVYLGIRKREGIGHFVVFGSVSKTDNKPSGFVFCTLPVTKQEAALAYQRVKEDNQINEVIFTDAMRRLSALCAYAPQIEKMDIFPVVVNARSLVALDAAVTIRRSI